MPRMSIALCSILLVACANTKAGAPGVSTDICNIQHDPDAYIGRQVEFSGTFKSDTRHYTFVEDEGCGQVRNLIDVGRAHGTPDYDVLNRKWRRECEARGDRGLCTVEKAVEIAGVVRQTNEHLVVDIDRIEEVEASPPPRK